MVTTTQTIHVHDDDPLEVVRDETGVHIYLGGSQQRSFISVAMSSGSASRLVAAVTGALSEQVPA